MITPQKAFARAIRKRWENDLSQGECAKIKEELISQGDRAEIRFALTLVLNSEAEAVVKILEAYGWSDIQVSENDYEHVFTFANPAYRKD